MINRNAPQSATGWFAVIGFAVIGFAVIGFAVAGLSVSGAAVAEDEAAATDPVWAFLAKKYDTDGNGELTAAEHGRGKESFGRLDKNKDGVISAVDFSPAGAGKIFEIVGPQILAHMFDQDGEADLTREELSSAARKFDANSDALISAGEFKAATADALAGVVLPMDPFTVLVRVADEDTDGALAVAELLSYFDRSDTDRTGVLVTGAKGVGDRRVGETGNREDENAAKEPLAAVGKVAPDFRLKPPDGGDAATLSAWVGKRPVALIFGSYT